MDIRKVREDPDLIKENQKKRFLDPNIVDQILELDQQCVRTEYLRNQFRKAKNVATSSFKNSKNNKDEHPLDDLVVLVNECEVDQLLEIIPKLITNILREVAKAITTKISDLENTFNEQLDKRDQLIFSLGNLLHPDVPVFKDEKDNRVIRTLLVPKQDPTLTYLDHIDLLPKLGMVDYPNGTKVAGNRGYFLTGMGVKLNRALVNYALDFLEQEGYHLMDTPHIVEQALMSKITQLADYEETLYKLDGYDKYLIATSEQPMTAMFSDTEVRPKQLPIRLAGVSTCYRKETGAHGRQTRGIYRVHQFEKVEQFVVCDPETSWELFDEMRNLSEKFLESLGIGYQVVKIVSGDLNNAAAMKDDIEGYFPGSDTYGELVSCTNCLDYFSQKIHTRLPNKKWVHMLNCTLCANTRVLCCLVETHQTDKGIIIPEPLRGYMGGMDFIPFVE